MPYPPGPEANLERAFRGLGRLPKWERGLLRENSGVILFEEFETKTGGRLDTVDITEEILEIVARSGVDDGSVLVFSPHTTCSVLIAQPSHATRTALEELMERLAPSDAYYAHDDLDIRTENLVEDEPANAPAHLMNAVMGKVSESLPVSGGELLLGEGQRVLFVEFDSSRPRRYVIQVTGE